MFQYKSILPVALVDFTDRWVQRREEIAMFQTRLPLCLAGAGIKDRHHHHPATSQFFGLELDSDLLINLKDF